MTTPDPFTTAEADKIKREVRQAEADYRMAFPVPSRLAPNLDLAVRAVHALVSAEHRAAYLAAQEPTEEEVRAAAFAVMQLDGDPGLDGLTYSHIAREALSAARNARRTDA